MMLVLKELLHAVALFSDGMGRVGGGGENIKENRKI